MAPLDWGLGHAARCVPLIRELLGAGCEVWIGAEGRQAAMLSAEFPSLTLLPLKGYRVSYAGNPRLLGAAILAQVPGIFAAIRREHQWLQQVADAHRLDAVISDNRYGLHHPRIPCIFITHQLRIRSPFGRLSGQWLQQMNYRMIARFRECWVPDDGGGYGLAGELSHPAQLPPRVRYIGSLSRFERMEGLPAAYEILVLLSGPEPARTRLEKKMLAQLRETSLKTMIVGGEPSKSYDYAVNDHIRHVSHLDTPELNRAICQSAIVISRSGYTTVMDLAKLHKKAILIPTPGQTEQEYLAGYLKEKELFYTVPEEKFILQEAIAEAGRFPFRFPRDTGMEEYRPAIRDLIASL